MMEEIERKLSLPGVSVLIGQSEWASSENWVCPPSSYVVCQRLSQGHSPLRLDFDSAGPRQVYPRVHALGFMPTTGTITLHPLGKPLRTLNCFFDRISFETATEMDAAGWRELAGSFMTVRDKSIEDMMQRIHRELMLPRFGSEAMIEATTTMIAVKIARLAKFSVSQMVDFRSRCGGLAPWQLRRIHERIAAAPETGYPGVQQLAELCGLSRSHLMRMFKGSTGSSLHEFIADHRLAAARQLLASDQLSIKQVAARLGFRDPAHFTNAFRRDEQMTPSEFRRRARAALGAPLTREAAVPTRNPST